jgi:hypothetical protein
MEVVSIKLHNYACKWLMLMALGDTLGASVGVVKEIDTCMAYGLLAGIVQAKIDPLIG